MITLLGGWKDMVDDPFDDDYDELGFFIDCRERYSSTARRIISATAMPVFLERVFRSRISERVR
jgi:hypothetical protein